MMAVCLTLFYYHNEVSVYIDCNDKLWSFGGISVANVCHQTGASQSMREGQHIHIIQFLNVSILCISVTFWG